MQSRSVLRDSLRILVLDQDPAFQRRLSQRFDRDGHITETAAELEDAERSIHAAPVDAIVASYEAARGADGLARLNRIAPTAPLLVTLSESSVSATVAAMRAGADDVIIRRAAAGRFISRLVALNRTRQREMKVDNDRGTDKTNAVISSMVGMSEPVRLLRGRVERFAKSDAPVLICGQSGTGREFVASMIHSASTRAREPLLVFDCAEESDERIQSEILGPYGAKGLVGNAISRALGGSLVLKNAQALPSWAQAAIAERLVAAANTGLIGADSAAPVRLLTLVEGTEGGRNSVLRPDLFHSLAVLTMTLPALKSRREDILPLARAFLERAAERTGAAFTGFTGPAERQLLTHEWPGNLDELARVVETAAARCAGPLIEADALALPKSDLVPANGLSTAQSSSIDVLGEITPYRDQERQIIERALEAFDGNITRAAAALEISPSTIHRKRQTWSDEVAA